MERIVVGSIYKRTTLSNQEYRNDYIFPLLDKHSFERKQIILLGDFKLRWLVGLKLIQLEQQKTQLPFIILAKKLKPTLSGS